VAVFNSLKVTFRETAIAAFVADVVIGLLLLLLLGDRGMATYGPLLTHLGSLKMQKFSHLRTFFSTRLVITV
jgi:hypothetical protein